MKAWYVRDEARGDDLATIVFAETRGKAHALALQTDVCEDANWNDVRVLRRPQLDSCYKGRTEMDWYDEEDLVNLVKAGFTCSYEIPLADCDCEVCVARRWCSRSNSSGEEVEG